MCVFVCCPFVYGESKDNIYIQSIVSEWPFLPRLLFAELAGDHRCRIDSNNNGKTTRKYRISSFNHHPIFNYICRLGGNERDETRRKERMNYNIISN